MCIIAAKPANTPMPSAERIRNMWLSNPDGAGFMYAEDGRVRIEKGFMTLEAFNARLEELATVTDLTRHSFVMHFRITTHGGTKPENCHPFPVSDNMGMLQKLKTSARVGIAHNGIISITTRSREISDTMEYIASQMAPLSRVCPEFYKNKDAMLMIKNAIDSKMAIMDSAGNLYTIGAFNTNEGVEYSNYSYEDYYKGYRGGSFRCYGWDADDMEDDYWERVSYSGGKYGKTPKALPARKETLKAPAPSDKKAQTGEPILMHGCYVRPQYLMDLTIIDGYVRTTLGAIEAGDDYYLDEHGHVYAYDLDCDICFRVDSYLAFGPDALPARFRSQYGEWLYCYADEDDYYLEHENDYKDGETEASE